MKNIFNTSLVANCNNIWEKHIKILSKITIITSTSKENVYNNLARLVDINNNIEDIKKLIDEIWKLKEISDKDKKRDNYQEVYSKSLVSRSKKYINKFIKISVEQLWKELNQNTKMRQNIVDFLWNVLIFNNKYYVITKDWKALIDYTKQKDMLGIGRKKIVEKYIKLHWNESENIICLYMLLLVISWSITSAEKSTIRFDYDAISLQYFFDKVREEEATNFANRSQERLQKMFWDDFEEGMSDIFKEKN